MRRTAVLLTTCLSFALALAGCSPQAPPPAAAAAPAAPVEGRPAADRCERHGITWHFDREHTIGTFCNGDPWVLGPVRVVAIDPASTEQAGRTLNGAMVDPDPSVLQHGYDSALFAGYGQFYRPELDAARAVAAGEPLLLRPGQSLVSVISTPELADKVPQLRLAAVLTCVDAVPAADAFRPPYCKAPAEHRRVRFRSEDLDRTALAAMRPVAGMPGARAFAAQFDKLWLDHFPSWVGRFAHPIDAMKDYGRDLCADVGSAALLLNTDVPLADREPLLLRFVQFGIDCHGVLRGGGRWSGNGGHASGRKFPILFAGRLLGDDAMLAIGREFRSERTARDQKGKAWFGEDSQTFFVRETAPGEFNWGFGGYTEEHRDLAEWGFAHVEQPDKDTVEWDANPYRRCCTACAWVGQCLAARAMGLVEAWDHDPFFAYVDRYLEVERRPEWRAWVKWHATMWDAERPRLQ
ncbi:MAG: hypothetical protein AB7O97_19925 [Planctomycetota bacterium]